MLCNELFESVIRETSEIDRSFKSLEIALFESVLREAKAIQKIKIKKTAIYRKWYASIKDDKLRYIIKDRLNRIKNGLFGDIRPERGVSEIFIDYGPGYRIYFIKSGLTVIILLCGGNKSTQDSYIIKANEIADDLKKRLNK